MTRALITGGAGFIGSHLADALLLAGNHVTVLDDCSTGRLANISHLIDGKDFRFIKGTILDEILVNELVSQADIIYHLAAAVGVDLVVKKPLESLATNIKGSEIVISAAQKYHKKILITSTSEIYGKNTKIPLHEDDDRILGSPLKSRWGYATAKAIDELIAYTYFKEKNLPAVIVRLFNTVGPRQVGAYGMVVPRFVGQAMRGEDITVYGTGKQLRCFLHVSDAVRAMTQLMAHDTAVGQVFNIGNNEEVAIEDLAKKIIALTQSGSKIVYVPYGEAYGEGFEDMQRRFPSTDRIRALIGWTPTRSLENILQSVIEALRV